MLKRKVKPAYQDKDDPTISNDSIEEFYYAILNSPELYPYFMEIHQKGLWRKCNKMASYITLLSNKSIITPADTEFLKKIHHSLSINESTYEDFTKLFAHICCRNKSDFRRKKMLSLFSLLKPYICPVAGSEENFAAFCKVILNLNPADWNRRPRDNFFFRSNDELSRSEIWNEQAQYIHLRKRLRRCEKLITVIQNKTRRMEMRITKLEENSKKNENMTKQQRDLELVCT